MGRKQVRTRQYIYFFITSLIFLSFSGCATLEKIKIKIKGEDPRHYLLHSQKLLAKGDYEGALKENEKVLSQSGGKPPGDEALFNMGLIYAHSENPKKDYVKSLSFFKRMMEDYPQSPWFEQAKIWTGMLQENEKLNQAIEELTQTIEKPKTIGKPKKADIQKKVDVKTEEHGEARESLLRAQKLLVQGDYEGALRENQKALSLSGNKPPGDEALFNMGLIYAHSGNLKKDYGKSLNFLKKLMKDYPQSPRAERAKIWIEMLQENQRLNQAVEELNRVIEKSKQVDIEIEEKKREKAK